MANKITSLRMYLAMILLFLCFEIPDVQPYYRVSSIFNKYD